MVERNIRIRNHNGTDFDNLYPETKSEIVIMSDDRDLQTAYDSLTTDVEGKLDGEDLEGYATITQLETKADSSNVYDKTEVDDLIDGVQNDGIHVGEDEPVGDVNIWFQEL